MTRPWPVGPTDPADTWADLTGLRVTLGAEHDWYVQVHADEDTILRLIHPQHLAARKRKAGSSRSYSIYDRNDELVFGDLDLSRQHFADWATAHYGVPFVTWGRNLAWTDGPTVDDVKNVASGDQWDLFYPYRRRLSADRSAHVAVVLHRLTGAGPDDVGSLRWVIERVSSRLPRPSDDDVGTIRFLTARLDDDGDGFTDDAGVEEALRIIQAEGGLDTLTALARLTAR